jgi:transposase
VDHGVDEIGVMRELSTFPQIYICTSHVDFRKSIDGLSAIVDSEMKLRPLSGALFVFMGRRKDRVKVLYWDRTGYSLWYKRLEAAKFSWPRGGFKDSVGTHIVMNIEQVQWLLDGVDVWKMKRHATLVYEKSS